MVVPSGQQYNIGEKPTVILYSYINRHAGTPEKHYCGYSMMEYDWWLCMVINISVQYNGGLLPDIILLTQGHYQAVGNPFKYHEVALYL